MDLLDLRDASTALIDESLWLQLRPLLAGIFRLRSGYSSATDPLGNFSPTGSHLLDKRFETSLGEVGNSTRGS